MIGQEIIKLEILYGNTAEKVEKNCGKKNAILIHPLPTFFLTHPSAPLSLKKRRGICKPNKTFPPSLTELERGVGGVSQKL
jgi:hypothetical protein